MVFIKFIFLALSSVLWADNHGDASKAAQQGAQQSTQNAMTQMALANSAKDEDTKNLLMMMAMQSMMQANQFQKSQQENSKNSQDKSESDSDKKDDSGLKIEGPKAVTNLLLDDKFNPKQDTASQKQEEKATVDESTIKKIFNGEDQKTSTEKKPEENVLSILQTFQKEQAAKDATTQSKTETAKEEPKALAGKELTPIAESNSNSKNLPLPSENKLSGLSVPNVFSGGSPDAAKKIGNDVGNTTDKSKKLDENSRGLASTSDKAAGLEGGSSSASESSKNSGNFFDMLLNQGAPAPGAEELANVGEFQQENSGPEKRFANIFQYASFRFEVAAYRQKKVRLSSNTTQVKATQQK